MSMNQAPIGDACSPDRNTDDNISRRVPARNAINALLRDAEKCWNIQDPGYWSRAISRMVEDRRITDKGARAALNGIDPRFIVSLDHQRKKRLGRETHVYDLVRLQPCILSSRTESKIRQETIILRRDVISLREKEVDIRTAHRGFAVTRHAIERLHERERCTPEEIVERLRSDMTGIADAIAFALATRLIKRQRNSTDADPLLRPGYMTMIPAGDGLLVVEILKVDGDVGNSRRTLMTKSGAVMTIGVDDEATTLPADPIDGRPAMGNLQPTGVTYLSYDYLRPEQRDYLALFEDHMEKEKEVVRALADTMGRVRLPHEPPHDHPRIEVPDRMRDMLKRNVNRNKDPMTWLSEGLPKKTSTQQKGSTS